MPTIHIERNHNFGLENARARVEEMAKALGDELQVDCEWSGDTLNFKRPGASGTIDVDVDTIQVNVDLGLPLLLMQGMIEQQINEHLDAAIG